MIGLSIGSAGSAAATSTIISQEISISHTNGVASVAYNTGGGEANATSAPGIAIAGGSTTPTLNGTWNTLLTNGQISSLKVKSNIVAADVTTAGDEDISIILQQCYVKEAGIAALGNRNSGTTGGINDNGAALTTGLPDTSSGDVGYVGTYVLESVQMNSTTGLFGHPGMVVGTNYLETPVMLGSNIASSGYWSYRFSIHEDYPTKVYKFIVELEVEF